MWLSICFELGKFKSMKQMASMPVATLNQTIAGLNQNASSIAPQYCLYYCSESCIIGLYEYGFIISAIFSVGALLVSFYNITMHFINFNNPYFQSKIIIILLMPPIYCVTSTLSFLSVTYSSYITLTRDFYEVVGLFAFFYLIFSFLAYNHDTNQIQDKSVYQIMMSQTRQISHDFPCSYFQKPYQLSNWIKAKYFSHRCKRAVMQYIIVKIITTAFLYLIYPNYQLRHREVHDWDYQIYQQTNTAIYWISTISSYIAFYYMGLFYNCLYQPLKPFNPDLKFVTINTTLFFTYWQKIMMVIFQNNILACFDHTGNEFNSKKIMYCLENTLICFEMLCMSFAGAQAYNYENYVVSRVKKIGSCWYIIKDIVKIFQTELRLIKPKIFGFVAEIDKSETELVAVTMTTASRIKTTPHFAKKDDCQINKRVIEEYF